MDNVSGIDIAISKLEILMQELSVDLKSTPELLARAKNVLKSLTQGFVFANNSLASAGNAEPLEQKPLTHFFGREITKPIQRPIADKEAVPSEVNYLRANALRLLEVFDEMKNSDILKDEQDMTIRAFAKMQGMDVSPTNPEKLDHAFIDAIRAAKIVKETLDKEVAKVKKGTKAPAVEPPVEPVS